MGARADMAKGEDCSARGAHGNVWVAQQKL